MAAQLKRQKGARLQAPGERLRACKRGWSNCMVGRCERAGRLASRLCILHPDTHYPASRPGTPNQ